MDEENKIEAFNPATIMFGIMAVMSDLFFLALIGLVIPAVGLAIALFVLLAHYFFGLIILVFFWGKTKGWLAKALLLLGWILPLPLLTTGLVLAIIASNKIGAIIIEQAAVLVVAVATGPGGLAAEGAAISAETAEGAEVVAEGVEIASSVAEGAEAAGAAGEAATEGAEAGAEATGGGVEAGETAKMAPSDELASPEEGNPMENLQEELSQPEEDQLSEGSGAEGQAPQEPEEPQKKELEQESGATKRLKKVFDIADRTNKQQEGEDGDEEESAQAA